MLFFDRFATATGLANPARWPIGQIFGQFTTASADRVHVHARDLGEQFCTTMTEPLCFDRNVPTSLLFIQSAQQDVHLVMVYLVWVRLR